MKVLIVRFSSIGDIVLTTPVIRNLKMQTGYEVHYICFTRFKSVVENNPYIDKLYTIDKSISEVIPELRKEKYDLIIDLHKNIRTLSLKLKLGRKSVSMNKLNIRKYLLVRFKMKMMPDVHIVDRYLKPVERLNVTNDGEGLDYFINSDDEFQLSELPAEFQNGYFGFVIGGRLMTKILPTEKVVELIDMLDHPVVLLGGQEDFERGEEIISKTNKPVFNACGQYSLNKSASIVEKSKFIFTNDTGLMHIAAAYKKPIISFWGNTVPELGMYPYLPKEKEDQHHIEEIKGLGCRPCSKIGYGKCPKGHFDCMMKIDMTEVYKKFKEIY